jgi:hypothetical protein
MPVIILTSVSVTRLGYWVPNKFNLPKSDAANCRLDDDSGGIFQPSEAVDDFGVCWITGVFSSLATEPMAPLEVRTVGLLTLLVDLDAAATQAKRLRAVGAIKKPFDPDDLLDDVSAAIGSQTAPDGIRSMRPWKGKLGNR